jgi:hypothetical protein
MDHAIKFSIVLHFYYLSYAIVLLIAKGTWTFNNECANEGSLSCLVINKEKTKQSFNSGVGPLIYFLVAYIDKVAVSQHNIRQIGWLWSAYIYSYLLWFDKVAVNHQNIFMWPERPEVHRVRARQRGLRSGHRKFWCSREVSGMNCGGGNRRFTGCRTPTNQNHQSAGTWSSLSRSEAHGQIRDSETDSRVLDSLPGRWQSKIRRGGWSLFGAGC